MVRSERLRCGPTGDLVHHRGFNLKVAATVEERANGAEDGSTFDEDLADIRGFGFGEFRIRCRFNGFGLGRLGWCGGRRRNHHLDCAGVHEQVDVSLAVTQFRVFEAVVLVGQGEHGLGEEGDGRAVADFFDMDGEFAGASAEEMAADADVVAQVEELVQRERVFADVVLADVDLEALATLLELRESGFPLNTDRHDAAGDADVDGCWGGFELFGGEGVVGGAELGDGVGGGVAVGIRSFGVGEAVRLTEGGDLLELVAALLVEIFFELRLVHEGSFGLRLLRFQYSGGWTPV